MLGVVSPCGTIPFLDKLAARPRVPTCTTGSIVKSHILYPTTLGNKVHIDFYITQSGKSSRDLKLVTNLCKNSSVFSSPSSSGNPRHSPSCASPPETPTAPLHTPPPVFVIPQPLRLSNRQCWPHCGMVRPVCAACFAETPAIEE